MSLVNLCYMCLLIIASIPDSVQSLGLLAIIVANAFSFLLTSFNGMNVKPAIFRLGKRL